MRFITQKSPNVAIFEGQERGADDHMLQTTGTYSTVHLGTVSIQLMSGFIYDVVGGRTAEADAHAVIME